MGFGKIYDPSGPSAKSIRVIGKAFVKSIIGIKKIVKGLLRVIQFGVI
jgi:hypothetical protein